MGLFNKKKDNIPKLSEENNIVRGDAVATVPVPVEEVFSLSVSQLLELVKGKSEGFQWKGDKELENREAGLTLTVKIGDCGKGDEKYSAQLLFVMKHEYFDDEMVESSVGVGNSADHAMTVAVEAFCSGVLPFVLSSLKGDEGEKFSVTLNGNEHIFLAPKQRGIFHYGSSDDKPVDLWNLVKDKIPQYLGTKKAYWIKLYSSYMGEKSACEVRINGIVYPDITDILYKHASSVESSSGFSSDKQFVLLIQDASTYRQCPFDIEQVRELTWEAIEEMKTVHDKDSHKAVFDEIRESTPIKSLGIELCTFIPEIYSQVIVNYRDSDGLMPVADRNSKSTVYMKSQIRSYGYIQYAIYRYIDKFRPSAEDNLKIVSLSAKFNGVNKAVSEGKKLSDIRTSVLGYIVDEEYTIW